MTQEKQKVGAFVREWRLIGDNHRDTNVWVNATLKQTLDQLGYPYFLVGTEGCKLKWLTVEEINLDRYPDEVDLVNVRKFYRWGSRNAHFDDFIRVGARLYFTYPEQAITCKLMASHE